MRIKKDTLSSYNYGQVTKNKDFLSVRNGILFIVCLNFQKICIFLPINLFVAVFFNSIIFGFLPFFGHLRITSVIGRLNGLNAFNHLLSFFLFNGSRVFCLLRVLLRFFLFNLRFFLFNG